MHINTSILGSSQEERVKLIQLMKSSEELSRKEESLKQTEICNDRLDQYVREHLEGKFSKDTVKEMPVVASINLAKRIIKAEASIYSDEPERAVSEINETQKEVIDLVYKDMRANDKLAYSNASFKLQQQNHVMIVPEEGKIILRPLRNHHVTSLQHPLNPEKASGYAIAAFDKNSLITDNREGMTNGGRSNRSHSPQSDNVDQGIGDADDYKAATQQILIWTADFNFIMNGKGEIISLTDEGEDDIENPIKGFIPIIDISGEKDFEYWVRQGNNLTEFTVEYNGALSSLGQVVSLQGFAQAFLKGPKGSLPTNLQIGPNHVLFLETDPASDHATEFGFASPNSDIKGSIEYVELLLSNYLSSRGLDPKLISGKAQSQSFTSGTERLLAMIDRFQATRSDFQLFERTEDSIWEIVKQWLNAYSGTDFLNKKYHTSKISDDSEMSVTFARPEMIEARADKVTRMAEMIDMGIASKVDAIAEIYDLDNAQAKEKLDEINKIEGLGEDDGNDIKPDQGDKDKGESEDQA